MTLILLQVGQRSVWKPKHCESVKTLITLNLSEKNSDCTIVFKVKTTISQKKKITKKLK